MARPSSLAVVFTLTSPARSSSTRCITQRCICTTRSRPKLSHHNWLIDTTYTLSDSPKLRKTAVTNGSSQRRYASAMPRPKNKVNSSKLERYMKKDMGPSMLTEQKRIGAGGRIGDYGLLPGTLIMPTGSRLPSAATRAYYRLQWTRLKKRVKDFATVFMYRWRSSKPRPKLRLRQTAATGQALHHELFTAFAEANTSTLTTLTADGLRQNLLSRVAARPAHTAYRWTVHRYLSRPRVVSHRAAELPVPDGLERTSAVRQAVVRIQSVQSLKRVDARTGRAIEADQGPRDPTGPGLDYTPTGALSRVGGNGEGVVSARTLATQSGENPAGDSNMNTNSKKNTEKREAGEEREIIEYVVLQKRTWRGDEGKWKIWGTVEESSQEDIDEISNVEEKKRGGVWERMKQAVSSSPTVGTSGMT